MSRLASHYVFLLYLSSHRNGPHIAVGSLDPWLRSRRTREWDWAVAFEDTCVGKERDGTYHRGGDGDGTLGSPSYWSSGVEYPGRRLLLSVFHVFNKVVNVGCCSSPLVVSCRRFRGFIKGVLDTMLECPVGKDARDKLGQTCSLRSIMLISTNAIQWCPSWSSQSCGTVREEQGQKNSRALSFSLSW